jgi:hypothetical protein
LARTTVLGQIYKKKERASKAQIRSSINRGNQSIRQIEDYYPQYIEYFKANRSSIAYFDFQMLSELHERIQTLDGALVSAPDDYANLEVTSVDSASNVSHLGSYTPESQDPNANAGFQQVRRDSQRSQNSQRSYAAAAATNLPTVTRTVTRSTNNVTNVQSSSNRPPLTTPASQRGPPNSERRPPTPVSARQVVVDPVSGREVIVEDVDSEPEPVPDQRSEISGLDDAIWSLNLERDDGGLDQEAFADDFRRLHGNAASAGPNLRSTAISDSRPNARSEINEFSTENIIRDAIIDPTGLENRVANLRRRAYALAEEASRPLSDIMDVRTPPPEYDQAVRQPQVPQPNGQEFVPIRLEPHNSYRAHAERWQRQQDNVLELRFNALLAYSMKIRDCVNNKLNKKVGSYRSAGIARHVESEICVKIGLCRIPWIALISISLGTRVGQEFETLERPRECPQPLIELRKERLERNWPRRSAGDKLVSMLEITRQDRPPFRMSSL